MPSPMPLPNPGRLRWQCRRGMLELDLLLQGFLDTAYGDLAEDQQRTFCRILEYQDHLLLDWLVGEVIPADPEVRGLVQRIRSAAQN